MGVIIFVMEEQVMNLRTILFGGIGTLVESSELQRHAFNRAFAEARLPWEWDERAYRALLAIPGGQNRIRHYRDVTGSPDDLTEEMIARLHSQKTDIYHDLMASGSLKPRPGVQRLIDEAGQFGIKVALASATSKSNIQTLAKASGLDLEKFAVVANSSKIEARKPAPDVYFHCLEELGAQAASAVAIEDSDSGVASAVAAGVACLATPGHYTRDLDFSQADAVVSQLGSEEEPAEVIRADRPLENGVIDLAWLAGLLKSS